MKLRCVFLLMGLLIAFQSVDAQSYLVLRKKGSTRRYEFFRGNEFVYKMKGFDGFIRDRITEFADSTIILDNNIILVEQLLEVDVRNASSNRNEFLRSAEGLLPVLGIGLLTIDLINHVIVDGQEFSLDYGTTLTAGSLVATGYLLKLMRRKTIKLYKPKFEAYIIGL